MSLQRGSERAADLTPSRPRKAYYEGPEHAPGMPRRTWYRVAALQRWRGRLVDECAWRMIRHLTHRADERGRLVELQAVIGSYAAVHRVSERIAWADLKRVRELGYVRQTAAAAPGRRARYVLSVPATLPAELPRSLARAVRNEIDPAADRARGRQTRVTMDANLAECEMVRYGSATRPAIMTQLGCGRLQTSPYTREGSPPSPRDHVLRSLPGLRRARSGGISDEEKATALYVVKGCGPIWARQRGGQVLGDAQAAELAPLVALLLRHMPPSEAVELLTEQTGSAVDLAGVVRYRIGRQLAAARRRARVRADEHGQGYAAAMATRAAAAAARYEQTQAGRQEFHAARAALEAARRRRRTGADLKAGPSSTRPPSAPRPRAAEPEAVLRAALGDLAGDPGDSRTAAAERAWLADATAAIRAEHERHGSHRLR
ncbi:hypothetical protein [Streptosporangium canum]|uniref:hypothetical protein n=1 Tax=Streptosporangium canum TaxID=324952 RepID=UPI0037917893